jgi:serine/threonine protein kinase
MMGLLEKECFRHRSGRPEKGLLSTPCGNELSEVTVNSMEFAETPKRGDVTRRHQGSRTTTTGSADVTSASPIDPGRDDDSTTRTATKAPQSASFPTFGLAESLEPLGEDGTALVGTWIKDRYVFLELIGQGGFGWVYRAQQQLPMRDVAIKVPRHAARMSRRVRQEADLLGTLEHEAIARVYDAGEFSRAGATTTYVVMELVRDAQPIDLFCAVNSLSTTQRIELFTKVCDAVAFAHGKGIVHRDLKPSNILVDRHGRPRVIDFGIATFFEENVRGESKAASRTFPIALITATTGLIGTPKYMSPEQRSAGHKVDARSDVFAMGKVLQDVLMAREQDAAAAPGSRVPDDLKAIQSLCLRQTPTERYADAGQLAEALRKWLAVSERHESLEKMSFGEPQGPRKTRRALIAAGCVTVFAIAALFLFLMRRSSSVPGDSYVLALRQAAQALADRNRKDAAIACRKATQIDRSDIDDKDALFPVELTILSHLSRPEEPPDELLPGSFAAADPSGHWLAAGDETGGIRLSLLDAPDRPIHRLIGLQAKVTKLRFSTKGRFLVGGDEDGRVCVWNIKSIETDASPRRLVPLDKPSPSGRTCSVDVSCDESRVAAADAAGHVCIWDCLTGNRITETTINSNPALGSMAICFGLSDGLFIGSPDGTLYLWPRDGSPHPLPQAHGAEPLALGRTNQGDMVASLGADATLRILAGDTGRLVGVPIPLTGSPQTAAWSLDGSRLLVARGPTGDRRGDAASAVDVFRVDPVNQGSPPELLVTLPLPGKAVTLSPADGSCVAVFDAPRSGMTVWKNQQPLSKEVRRPALP